MHGTVDELGIERRNGGGGQSVGSGEQPTPLENGLIFSQRSGDETRPIISKERAGISYTYFRIVFPPLRGATAPFNGQ